MTDLLVRGAAQLWTGQRGASMRATGGNDIRVRAGVVHAIGTLTPQTGERVIDAGGCVIYPGWVNTHHHLFQSLLKGIPAGINLALVPWLAAVPVAYRRHFDTEHALRIAARVGLVELLLSGCSTVADHQYHYWPGMPFDASAAVFDEAEQTGPALRAVPRRPDADARADRPGRPAAGDARDAGRLPRVGGARRAALPRPRPDGDAPRGQRHHHAQLELQARRAEDHGPRGAAPGHPAAQPPVRDLRLRALGARGARLHADAVRRAA